MDELELGVSKALGISPLEVRDQYFRDSGESQDQDLEGKREHKCWLEKWARKHQLEYQSY
jgi:hypothetical protein